MSWAVLLDEQAFLKNLRKAMRGGTGGQAAYLKKFRFLMRVLAEGGALDLPNRVLTELVIDLGAYAGGYTAQKNVGELVRKTVKKYTISK